MCAFFLTIWLPDLSTLLMREYYLLCPCLNVSFYFNFVCGPLVPLHFNVMQFRELLRRWAIGVPCIPYHHNNINVDLPPGISSCPLRWSLWKKNVGLSKPVVVLLGACEEVFFIEYGRRTFLYAWIHCDAENTSHASCSKLNTLMHGLKDTTLSWRERCETVLYSRGPRHVFERISA